MVKNVFCRSQSQTYLVLGKTYVVLLMLHLPQKTRKNEKTHQCAVIISKGESFCSYFLQMCHL